VAASLSNEAQPEILSEVKNEQRSEQRLNEHDDRSFDHLTLPTSRHFVEMYAPSTATRRALRVTARAPEREFRGPSST
jgi:hypothetical protein